ncbi:hypothetical protein BC835DRAFT_844308 [Cytidiella melzeri]|nr:hypothetical protein BC835DRAFT_844308 [Cytidiella melzeri]
MTRYFGLVYYYLHILESIKHSSFFAPTFSSTFRPAHARLAGSDWNALSERERLAAWKHEGAQSSCSRSCLLSTTSNTSASPQPRRLR